MPSWLKRKKNRPTQVQIPNQQEIKGTTEKVGIEELRMKKQTTRSWSGYGNRKTNRKPTIIQRRRKANKVGRRSRIDNALTARGKKTTI